MIEGYFDVICSNTTQILMKKLIVKLIFIGKPEADLLRKIPLFLPVGHTKAFVTSQMVFTDIYVIIPHILVPNLCL